MTDQQVAQQIEADVGPPGAQKTGARPLPAIDDYYRRLGRWTAFGGLLGYGGGRGSLTVHRALADPRAGGRPTPRRLHDVLVDTLTRDTTPRVSRPRVLDAGCGYGGTMIDLCRRLGGTYVGVTASTSQAEVGRRAIARLGMAGQIRIDVGTYDAPPTGPFDLIIAVESLAHSTNPSASINALANVLASGGRFVVVDDMPEPAAACDPDLVLFRNGWKCPVLLTADEYRRTFEGRGLRVQVDMDLSSACRPRTVSRIRTLERMNALARRLVPSAAWRGVLDSYRGGLALERLCRRGLVRYRLMVME